MERIFCQGAMVRPLLHEINNSLTGILGYTQLFLGSEEEGKGESHDLRTVEQEVYRLRKMVYSFMNLFESSPGVEGPLEMNSLLDLLLLSLQDQPSFSPLKVIKQFFPGDLYFRGNLDLWRAILVGLLLKAARSMQRGDILRVSTSQEAGGVLQAHIETSVARMGEGITPPPFIPFYSPGGRVRDLVIHLARRAVRQSGGSLKVKYRPTGWGISIALPLQDRK
ncbi:MAG: hypothetical protein QHH30_01150 [candidate division NC10 bacterium]|nr:hypothetical protein [candidate division NC10 bacterium]